MAQSFLKDPDSVVDYVIDWATWLAGTSPVDTISTSTWTAETGITIDSDTNSTTRAKVWLSGGSDGTTYTVTNRIVTAGSRTADRSLRIVCRSR